MTYLEHEIQAQIAWNTLALYDTSLIGHANQQLYADVVYTAKTKHHNTDVFLLLNHQRKPDPLLPIRQLEYLLGTLKKSIQQKKKPAFMLQLTWYNGPKGLYPYAQNILDYFQEPLLAQKLLYQTCKIINPHDFSDEELARHRQTNVLALFMKHAASPDLLGWLENHPAMVKKLAKNKYIKRALEYVADVGAHPLEDLLATFEKISSKLKETMLTTAQQLRKEGLQQGMQQEKLGIAKNMLWHLHLDMDIVQKATGLSIESLKQLQKGVDLT